MKLTKLYTSINEFKQYLENKNNNSYQIYHNTYSSAIDEITKYVNNLGYSIDEDDLVSAYTDAFFKPKDGQTKKDSFKLYKNEKELKKYLNVQIYNRGNDKFELNMYIN